MEAEVAWFSLPLFRTGFSTQSVYETHKCSNYCTKKINYTADSLLRRYYGSSEVSRRNDCNKGYAGFSVTIKVGFPDKFGEIILAGDTIFGDSCRLQ